MSYYVYQLVNPKTNMPFYVGKGSGNRAELHLKFRDKNNNYYKDKIIKDLLAEGLKPTIEYLYLNILDEKQAYELEEKIIKTIGLENLTNILLGPAPPSKKGWKPSTETLKKRSQSLKGIPRTDEWKQNLSKAKIGKNNPMFGKKVPCTKERKMSIIKSKNEKNYIIYKQAIELMNEGMSADKVSIVLGIGRGVCFRLKNRSHQFFLAFPELI